MKKITYLGTILLIVSLFTACKPYENLTTLQSMNELVYPYDVKRIQLNDDVNIAYIDEGKGSETIIFIHGLGSYLPAWKNNIDSLKKQYRCIALDLPGYGKSSKNPTDGSMSYYADVVMQFAAKLQIDKPIVCGHSMGGQIAVVAALRYPTSIKKLILTAPAGFETFHEGQKQWFREAMSLTAVKLTSVEQIQTNFGYNFYKMPKSAEFMITDRINMRTASDFDAYCHAIAVSVQGMVDEPVFEKLPQIKIPVLAIFGEQDNLIPNRFLHGGRSRSIGEKGVAQLPNGQLKMINKAGHFVQFEQPNAFNALVLEFLK